MGLVLTQHSFMLEFWAEHERRVLVTEGRVRAQGFFCCFEESKP